MALTASELAVVSVLLDEALALDASERASWLATLPAERAALVPMLREMLARADTRSGMLLDKRPRLSPPSGANPSASELNAGDRVGPYELIRELGVGGMGEVWLARRADGAYRREVALKLPKHALTHKDPQSRFARERDILARLEHPNIARLYDAGVSPHRMPYIAMEYVQGEPLTAWCDRHRASLRERLQLFLEIAGAAQYAHERQVIHRDLKPSNILVATMSRVRLLDFGIAKLLEEDEGSAASMDPYTRAVTPDYASPELLAGRSVDARSDVYSLGVVLHELLAGTRPYRLHPRVSATRLEFSLPEAALEPPSTRLAPRAGIARATTQDRLAGRLRGELDAITLKALARDPQDRYPSAAVLAEDLQRYLRGEHVEAMPPPNRLTNNELVARLARNPNVRVRAKADDAWQGGSGQPPPRETGAAGNGNATLAESLRIEAQLIRSVDGLQLWSQAFDLRSREGSDLWNALPETIGQLLRAALDSPGSGLALVVNVCRISEG